MSRAGQSGVDLRSRSSSRCRKPWRTFSPASGRWMRFWRPTGSPAGSPARRPAPRSARRSGRSGESLDIRDADAGRLLVGGVLLRTDEVRRRADRHAGDRGADGGHLVARGDAHPDVVVTVRDRRHRREHVVDVVQVGLVALDLDAGVSELGSHVLVVVRLDTARTVVLQEVIWSARLRTGGSTTLSCSRDDGATCTRSTTSTAPVRTPP